MGSKVWCRRDRSSSVARSSGVGKAARRRIQIRLRTQSFMPPLAAYPLSPAQLKAYIQPSSSVPDALALQPVRIDQSSSSHVHPAGSKRSALDDKARLLPSPRLKLGSLGNRWLGENPLKGTWRSNSTIISSTGPLSPPPSPTADLSTSRV